MQVCKYTSSSNFLVTNLANILLPSSDPAKSLAQNCESVYIAYLDISPSKEIEQVYDLLQVLPFGRIFINTVLWEFCRMGLWCHSSPLSGYVCLSSQNYLFTSPNYFLPLLTYHGQLLMNS